MVLVHALQHVFIPYICYLDRKWPSRQQFTILTTHLTKNQLVEEAIKDKENDMFWKALYILLRSVFPALKALRYCDSDIPSMDNFFVQGLDDSLIKLQILLNDEEHFGPMKGVAIAECEDELAEFLGSCILRMMNC